MENTSLSLLERAREGEPSAWNCIVSTYNPFLDYWLHKWGAHTATEDLKQEILLRAWRGLNTFQATPNSSFRGWLLVISKNVIRDYFQQRAIIDPVGGSSFHAWLADRPDEAVALDADTPLPESTELLIMRQAVMNLRELTSEHHWKMFVETSIKSRSSAEVAEQFGVTAASVRQVKARMMKQLRKLLQGLQTRLSS